MRTPWSTSPTHELLRSMDPTEYESHPAKTPSQVRENLLYLAETNQRASTPVEKFTSTRSKTPGAPLSIPPSPTPGSKQPWRRRGLAAATAATALSLAGGTAYAATTGWEPVKQAWSQLIGGGEGYDADTPGLVATGTTNDGRQLQLWRALNARGGDCVSVRVNDGNEGLDSCGGGGGQAEPSTNVQVEPAETLLGSPTAWVVYGHFETTDGISAVVLQIAGQTDQTMTVNADSGYWIGEVASTDMNTATLEVVDGSGETLGERALNSWDENLTVANS